MAFEFETSDLHFAAYVKTNGAVLLSYEGKRFRFRSDKAVGEWRVQHANSCCRRVDQELMQLRKFVRGEVDGMKS